MSSPFYPPFESTPQTVDSGLRRDVEVLKRRPMPLPVSAGAFPLGYPYNGLFSFTADEFATDVDLVGDGVCDGGAEAVVVNGGTPDAELEADVGSFVAGVAWYSVIDPDAMNNLAELRIYPTWQTANPGFLVNRSAVGYGVIARPHDTFEVWHEGPTVPFELRVLGGWMDLLLQHDGGYVTGADGALPWVWELYDEIRCHWHLFINGYGD